MRYRVWDIEDNKERTLENCVIPLEVGTVRRVTIKRAVRKRYIILGCWRFYQRLSKFKPPL